MLRRIATIFVVILLLPVFVSAQEHTVLKPDGKIYKYKGELKNLEVQRGKQVISESRKIQDLRATVYSGGGTIDTLKLPTDSWSGFQFSGQDWQVQWYEAPADLDLLQVGFSTSNNTADFTVEVKVIKVEWTRDMLTNADVLNRGYYEATGNGFNDISAFADNPDITGGWVNVDNPETSEPFGADIWSDGGVGFPIEPIEGNGPDVYKWVDLSILFVPTLLQGDIFAICLKHNDPIMASQPGASPMVWHGAEIGLPSWKFYANGRLTTGGVGVGDPGWWSRTWSWNYIAIVNLTGDRAPVISNVTGLGTTLSTAPRTISATIIDDNPSGGAFGVADASLLYSLDAGTTWTTVAMTASGDVYSADIPGQPGGQLVDWFIMTTDVQGLSSETIPASYSVFAKENDILFIYNVTDFSRGTATFFYIGDGTANPLGHDYWSIDADGVAELDLLLTFYDNVLQVDGSFPTADISGSIDAWIATGTAGSPKSYLQSSQDFGCLVTGDCSDISFTPGSFMYDIMGVATLGPQDFSGGSSADMQIVGVDADPVSGWVETYSAANSVTFWYNPAAELGVTNWIDAITPAAGATTIFTEPSSGNVVGVRNSGKGWFTSFLSYDYLGCDFLADSSGPVDFGDPTYAWGVQVVSQAWAFFTWAGVVSVERENNLLPDEYSLS
ncbi:MAG: hypothetical protein O6940_12965, partial [Ignavibacteria bacterium]|nr:hypothetical protein [Ignavibacteria bacterium]